MTTPFDSLTAVQDGVFDVLAVGSASYVAPVHVDVPSGEQPPYYQVGDMEASNPGGEDGGVKDGGLDLVTFEIACIYRGEDRRELFAMMNAARADLEGVPISAAGARLGKPVFLNAVANRPDEGNTYEGIIRFQTYAQPA